MNQISTETQVIDIESGKEQITRQSSQYSKGEMMTMGVITGVAATTIIETGKGVLTTLSKHPLVMFSMGIAAGVFVHKYRKEIISITNKTAEQSKDFVLRQKENIKDLLTETQVNTEEKDV